MSAHAGKQTASAESMGRHLPLRALRAALAVALALPLAAGAEEERDGVFYKPDEQRPADLVVLREWSTIQGTHLIGVHGMKPDPNDPAARTIVVWVESPTGVQLAVDTLRCSASAPMRLTKQANRLLIKELNPGGQITEANRLDHQIWWAACHPEQAGKNPALLAPLARQLGYSGQLIEQQQVLPGQPR
ncbi:MAG: hypothetical protein FJ053_06530 [Cyanobacteria bacterium M_surface_10_m1_298]|nr:hypothetical protein [Cyanobacteria bacterium M_surface_10_m1_298]